MAKDASFDIVSECDLQEVGNAVNQAQKELETRFDFKGSKSSIEQNGAQITLIADDEFKLDAVIDILKTKLVRREVSLKSLEYGKIEPASQGTVRQVITMKQGLAQEVAKTIIKLIKDSKLKVQASIQGDQVRVTGKSKDDLQAVISLLRGSDLPVELQFVNYR
nr:YajQ family cyclic di-GMP-binding protein [Bacilli bacterium]